MLINFIHTIVICLLSIFGWYNVDDTIQQQVDSKPKLALSYHNGIMLSIGDLLDEQRYMGFMNQFQSYYGSEYDWSNDFELTFLANNCNIIVNVTLQDRVYQWIPTATSYLTKFTIHRSVVAPAAGNTGYYKYDCTLYNGNDIKLSWYWGYYLLSGDYYFQYPEYLKGLFFSGIISQGLVYPATDIFKYGLYISDYVNPDADILVDNLMYDLFAIRFVPSTDQLVADAYDNGYLTGYGQGEETGYSNGYQAGDASGFENGYNDGYNTAYQIGYNAGLLDGQSYDQTALTIFTGIIEVGLLPVNIFLQMFNYEVFGINISGIVSALLTISIVIIIIRFLLGKKDD